MLQNQKVDFLYGCGLLVVFFASAAAYSDGSKRSFLATGMGSSSIIEHIYEEEALPKANSFFAEPSRKMISGGCDLDSSAESEAECQLSVHFDLGTVLKKENGSVEESPVSVSQRFEIIPETSERFRPDCGYTQDELKAAYVSQLMSHPEHLQLKWTAHFTGQELHGGSKVSVTDASLKVLENSLYEVQFVTYPGNLFGVYRVYSTPAEAMEGLRKSYLSEPTNTEDRD